MQEQSKSAKRRFYDGNFISKYFVGAGLDIGCGNDPVSRHSVAFPLLKSVLPWDKEQGDAQVLETLAENQFDFIHASHSLEHMDDPYVALRNWIRVVKPGGYLILTVPDEDLYEHGIWPSQFSSEHKWSFTICKSKQHLPKSINVVDLVARFADSTKCHKVQLIDDFFSSEMSPLVDQTMLPNAECSIEIILQKL